MKISEMTNEQATEAMIRLAEPIGNLCDDEKAMELLQKYKSMSDMPFIRTIGRILPEFMAYAFKTHKADLFEIVGALNFKTAKEVGDMNFIDTVNIVRESYDDVLKGFFQSSKALGKNTGAK